MPYSQRNLALLLPRCMHEIRFQWCHAAILLDVELQCRGVLKNLPCKSLLDYPPIITRCGILHTFVDVCKSRCPFEMPMLVWYRRLVVASLLLNLSLSNPLLVLIRICLGVLHSIKAAAMAPVILQHLRPKDLLVLNIRYKRHIHRIYVGIRIPILYEVLHDLDAQPRCTRNNIRVVLPRQERITQRDSFPLTNCRLERSSQCPRTQRKTRRGIAAVVRPAEHEVDRAALLEEVVQSDLDTTCRGTIDEDPVVSRGRGALRGHAVVFVEGARAEVRRLHGLADDVRFADPAALFTRENDRDDMAGFLEVVDERVDVRGALVAGGSVVVDYLAGLSATPHSAMKVENWERGNQLGYAYLLIWDSLWIKLLRHCKIRTLSSILSVVKFVRMCWVPGGFITASRDRWRG